MKVLITRPEPDASHFGRLLTKHGMTPVLAPVIDIQFDPAPVLDTEDVTHLAFTSANGVRAMSSCIDGRVWPAFAVGPVTATALAGEKILLAGVADSSVESMADLIVSCTDDNAVILHIAGAHRAGDLQDLLKEKNRQCRLAVLYEAHQIATLPSKVQQQLRDDEITAATFFSQRSANLFLSLLGKHRLLGALTRLQLICLSQAIAGLFKNAGASHISVAERPDQSAMIDILLTAQT